MKSLQNKLTTQNKLIISALTLSTLLIVGISFWAVDKVKSELDESYRSFGQLLTKTLAVQNYEIAHGINSATTLGFIKAHVNSILSSTNDISYITFKNKVGDVIYTTIETYSKRASKADTNISSPMLDENGKVVGTVEVGLSADLAKNVTTTTKNSMLTVFCCIWLVFTLVILVNAFLIRRELTLLHHGVKEIEEGRFGTVLEYNQASGEIKELFDAFNKMSKKLHKYEEQNIDELTIEKNKLEAVLMSIANGVVVCDNYDKITIINSAALKILNGEEKDILNTSIQEYCDTTGELCFKEKIAIFKNTPLDVIEQKPLEFNINVDNRIIKTIISPMYSKMHDYLGYIIILIDVTKEAEVDRLKDDFISNVSHELRTPVTILSSYADTLYNYGEQFNFEEQKEFIGTINEEVVRLNKMVNDILDFSKMESDNVLEKEKQNIVDTIEKIAHSMQVLADEKNISITVIKEDNLPLVNYNTQSIERVMTNLISNAIKYSPNDSRVKIRAELSSNSKYVEVTVQDMGIGISPENQKKIFERFYRIENQVHTIKGTGLGLHLVKTAIEKHHQGHVFVRSKLNEGSTFGFQLPIESADLENIAQDNNSPVIDVIPEASEPIEEKEIEKKEENIKEETIEEVEEDEPIEALTDTEYQEYKVETLEDYNRKAEFDLKQIGIEAPQDNFKNEIQNNFQETQNSENNHTNPIEQEKNENDIKEEISVVALQDSEYEHQFETINENQVKQENKLSSNTSIEDEWEITFEVRD